MAINGEQFLQALDELEALKGINKLVIIKALKEAMIKGYKKQIGATDTDDNVRVNIDPETGNIEMYQVKNVVAEVEDDFLEISVEDANEANKKQKYAVGDEFIIPASPDDLTKAVALSVKSILKQKLAEAEKDVLLEAFKDKIGTMITGKVEKADERGLSVNIGRASVYLPHNQMIGDERFKVGDPIKLFVSNVDGGSKGARIVVSRASEGFLRCLFNEEIREIEDGLIVIKGIAREAGERSKVAVYTDDVNVDPAGACIGPNGSRIQKIVGQLGNNGQSKEKIDIITYSDIPGLYIMEALKPARVVGINVDLENKSALAVVKDDSFSLAIGKKGVNVRLAVKLTGYNIDIKTESQAAEEGIEFVTFEELQAQEQEAKSKAAYEKLAAQYQSSISSKDVLPGLPEGYVAPQDRSYNEEKNEELQEALEQASEKEEVVETVAPTKEEPKAEEVKEEVAPAKEEKEVKQEVKTTTSLEDLEKALSEDNKQEKKTARKFNKKKKEDNEEELSKGALDTSGAERMSIYTEEELREMEEEENREEEEYDEDVDYDDYDEYYDDDDR